MPFKGPALAAVLYGDLALREFTDLDILIRERDIPKAREILSNQGYRSNLASAVITPDVNVDELHSASTGISIELHWQFSPRRFVSSMEAEHVWNGIKPCVILGRQVWSFSSQDMFLFLAVHGGKHSWSALKWLCDLAEFIRSNPELDWPHLFNRAEALGAARTCRLGIYLAAELLQAEVPSSIVCAVREDAQVRRLAQHVRLRIEEPRDVDPIEGQIFNLKLKERFHDKVRYVFLQFTRLSFAKILWCREINSLYSFLNPCICYNLGHVPLLATLIRSLGSPLSPPWQFAAGEPRPSATGLCPETKESTTEVDRNG